jgi:hypothetical protein
MKNASCMVLIYSNGTKPHINTSLLNGTNLKNTSERAIIPFPKVSTHFTLHYNFFLQGRVCQANETERKCEVISFIN